MSKAEDHIAALSAKAKDLMERLGHAQSFDELNEAEQDEVISLWNDFLDATGTMEWFSRRGRLTQKDKAGIGPFIAWAKPLLIPHRSRLTETG